jgi:hypothetical protein
MNAAALMDRRVNPRCAYARKPSVSDHYLRLLVAGGVLAIIVTAARADEQLPAVTVTGQATPPARPPDTVGRDWIERSPEVHWPTAMFNGASEIFAHNQIVINASCETVWDRLIHAEQWPRWCPYSGFRWLSSDLPQDIGIFATIPPDWVDAQVVECDPPTRLGWSSHGRQWTIHGPLVASYHNWYIKPMGAKRCLVTFEEVATGVAARYTRGSCPELVHLSHEHWLEDLKRISETRS